MSILSDIRDALGLGTETAFDAELSMHIASAMSILFQMGLDGADHQLDAEKEWSSIESVTRGDKQWMLPQIKYFIFLKTKQLFDPPPPSAAGYMNEAVNELAWRIREEYGWPQPTVDLLEDDQRIGEPL